MDRKILLRRMRKNKFFIVGTIVTIFILLTVYLSPLYVQFNPERSMLAERLQGPSLSMGMAGHILGTDALGRDVFTRLVVGGRYSLSIALVIAVLQLIVGTTMGLLAGYGSKTMDTVIMRLCDVFLALPNIILAMAFIAIMGTSIVNLIIVLTLSGWVQYCRVIRNNVQVIRRQEYIQASKAFGASHFHIMFRQILPNVTTPMIIIASQKLGNIILIEAALSFLNLGIPAPTPSWGNMISDGRAYLATCPWLVFAPGIALMLTALAFNCLGDGLRDVLDPKTL